MQLCSHVGAFSFVGVILKRYWLTMKLKIFHLTLLKFSPFICLCFQSQLDWRIIVVSHFIKIEYLQLKRIKINYMHSSFFENSGSPKHHLLQWHNLWKSFLFVWQVSSQFHSHNINTVVIFCWLSIANSYIYLWLKCVRTNNNYSYDTFTLILVANCPGISVPNINMPYFPLLSTEITKVRNWIVLSWAESQVSTRITSFQHSLGRFINSH